MGISMDIFRSIVKRHNMQLEELKGFYAVRAGGRSVYLSKRENCGRVDLSGFLLDHPGVREIERDVAEKRKIGRVMGQLDFSKDESIVLEAFDSALDFMKALATAEEAALKQVSADRPIKAAIPVRTIEKEALKTGKEHRKNGADMKVVKEGRRQHQVGKPRQPRG